MRDSAESYIYFVEELRAEIEVRKKYTDLELKHRKLKKQLQKLKKRADNPYKSLQGKAGKKFIMLGDICTVIIVPQVE